MKIPRQMQRLHEPDEDNMCDNKLSNGESLIGLTFSTVLNTRWSVTEFYWYINSW